MNGVPAMLMGVSTGVATYLGDIGSLSVSSDSLSESGFTFKKVGDKVVANSAAQLLNTVNIYSWHTIGRTSSRRI